MRCASQPFLVALICTLLSSATMAQQHPIALFDAHKLADDWVPNSSLIRWSREKAGKTARNCGRVRSASDPSSVTDCALRTFGQGKRFYGSYDVQGIDVELAIGLVFDGKTLYRLTWDYGGLRFFNRENLRVETCPMPVNLRRTANGKLDCRPPSSNEGYLSLD